VSHQQVPKKKQIPKIQPKTNDFTADSFSRSMAKKSGTSANHARNHQSKLGKESVKRMAESKAKSEFMSDGNLALAAENFITDILAKKFVSCESAICALFELLGDVIQFERLSIKLNGQTD